MCLLWPVMDDSHFYRFYRFYTIPELVLNIPVLPLLLVLPVLNNTKVGSKHTGSTTFTSSLPAYAILPYDRYYQSNRYDRGMPLTGGASITLTNKKLLHSILKINMFARTPDSSLESGVRA